MDAAARAAGSAAEVRVSRQAGMEWVGSQCKAAK